MSSAEAVQATTTKPAQSKLTRIAASAQMRLRWIGRARPVNASECKTKRLIGKPLQAKLHISEPGDEYEQEADRVADK